MVQHRAASPALLLEGAQQRRVPELRASVRQTGPRSLPRLRHECLQAALQTVHDQGKLINIVACGRRFLIACQHLENGKIEG